MKPSDFVKHYDIQHGNVLMHVYFITHCDRGNQSICNIEHSEIKWFYRPELDFIALASSEYLYIIDAWERR